MDVASVTISTACTYYYSSADEVYMKYHAIRSASGAYNYWIAPDHSRDDLIGVTQFDGLTLNWNAWVENGDPSKVTGSYGACELLDGSLVIGGSYNQGGISLGVLLSLNFRDNKEKNAFSINTLLLGCSRDIYVP